MAFAATANNKTGGGDYSIPPEGNHVAVLVAMVDLGTHNKEFKDKDSGEVSYKDYRQIFLAWELTDEVDPTSKGKNFVMGREYSLALGLKAALRGVVEVWKGRKLEEGEDCPDLEKMVGMKCMLTVQHGKSAAGKDYANIKAVTPVHKSLTVKPPLNTPYLYEIEKGKFNPPPWLPAWSFGEQLKDIIARSQEVKGAQRGPAAATSSVDAPMVDGVAAF